MDVETAKAAKQELEFKLIKLVNKFMEDTGTTVIDLHLTKVEVNEPNQQERSLRVLSIEAEVSL